MVYRPIKAGILLIGPLGTNFSEILIEIYTFSIKIMHLKISPGKCRSFCLGLNVLTGEQYIVMTSSPILPLLSTANTLKPEQYVRHFADYIFKWIFLNEYFLISSKTSLTFVSNAAINNSFLVQIIDSHRTDAKLLPELKPLAWPISQPNMYATQPQFANYVLFYPHFPAG